MEVNGTEDQNESNNNISTPFSIGGSSDQYATLQVLLELITDDYAEETSWEFREVGGSIIDSGSYNEGSDDNTTFTETFDVELDNCYEFELFDSYGDGICCQYGEGEYTLSTSNGEVIFEGAEFTDSELTQMSIGGELSINDASLASIALYPNPADSEIILSTANTNDSASYSLYNTFGQLLKQDVVSNNKAVISVSQYATGIYFVVVKNTVTNIETTLRFIKQ
ncbi:MAG: Uncharacterised protein [Flavobacteriaceae bacterium]|nr:MAG: Uncharacterised protein [Flavobacteriaceae bacterium]